MLQDIERLLVLQDRDRKIRALRQELKHAPLERKRLDETLTSSQKQLDALKLKGKEVEVERHKLEVDVEGKRGQIAKYQTQKFQTRKNEEFAAFTTAIEHLERDIRTIEDRELELMEATEVLKPQIADADKGNQAAKALVQRQVTDLDAKVKVLQEQIAGVEEERKKQAAEVDEDLLYTYDRLFTNKGEAVVALEHEVCTGCHMKVTASTIASAKAGRSIVHCEQCGRILYYNAL